MTRIAVVVHGLKADTPDAALVRSTVTAKADAERWPAPEWLVTTKEDPGRGLVEQALREGVELLVVVGGDGTVSSCAAGLAGTGVPMGIVPMGTGNLIARNLKLPSTADAAIEIVLNGSDRAIDVGRCGDRVIVAMAGVGLDAAMIADAPRKLKNRWGWPAYAVSIARHLGDRGVDLTLTLDGSQFERRRVRALVIGNVGRLQGGIRLLPDARPDSGQLDVVVLAPAGLLGWIPVVLRLLARRRPSTRSVERFQARHVIVRSREPIKLELDGESFGSGSVLDVEVDAGALVVRVPADCVEAA